MGRRRKPENNQPSPRNLEIYARICEGKMSRKEISAKYGCSQPRLCRIRNRVEAWFRPQWSGKICKIKEKQTKLLMIQYLELQEAWEASKGVEVVITETVDENGDTTSKRQKRKQTGDPRYQSEMRQVLADIRKIWGADAPTKAELSGPDGEPLQLSVDERRTGLTGIIARLRERAGSGGYPQPVNGAGGVSGNAEQAPGDFSTN